MKTRILSWLLILSMVFSCLPVTALAAEGDDQSSATLFHVDFDSLPGGTYNPAAEGAPFVKKTLSNTYSIDVVSEGGSKALKMTTTTNTAHGSLELKSKDTIPAGNYTVEVRVKADENGYVSQFQLPGITFPIAAGTGPYTLNFTGSNNASNRNGNKTNNIIRNCIY